MKIKFPVQMGTGADIRDVDRVFVATASWWPADPAKKYEIARAQELVRILNAAHEAGLTAKKRGKG
jgi:hypothetical protein